MTSILLQMTSIHISMHHVPNNMYVQTRPGQSIRYSPNTTPIQSQYNPNTESEGRSTTGTDEARPGQTRPAHMGVSLFGCVPAFYRAQVLISISLGKNVLYWGHLGPCWPLNHVEYKNNWTGNDLSTSAYDLKSYQYASCT